MSDHSLLRTGSVVIAGQVSVAVIGVCALRLFTELTTPRVFGQANLLLGVLTLGMQIFIAPFTASQLRYHSHAQARGVEGRFTQEALRWSLLSALLLGLAVLVGLPIWLQFHGEAPQMLVALSAMLWSLSTAARNVLMNCLQAARLQATSALLQVVEALLLLLFTAALLHNAASLEAYVGGQALGMLSIVILLWAFRRAPVDEVQSSTQFLSLVRGYGMVFIPMALLSFLANLADRYTVGLLLGAAAVGHYVAPFAVANRGMALINTGLNDVFRPMLFDAENQLRAKLATRIFRQWVATSLVLTLGGLLLLYLCGSLIASLLLAVDYRASAGEIMLWVGGGYAINGLNQIFESRLLSLGRSARLLPSMTLGAAANVIFSFLLIPSSGIVGAAEATCGSFLIQGLASGVMLGVVLRQIRSVKADSNSPARMLEKSS